MDLVWIQLFAFGLHKSVCNMNANEKYILANQKDWKNQKKW